MLDEQIKKEISDQIAKKFGGELNLFTLPLISQYRTLLWSGPANGAFLEPNFPIADIQGKIIVIKSLKLVPYSQTAVYIDIAFSDGTTEGIPQFARLDRLFDNFRDGFRIQMIINGVQLSIFGWLASAAGYTVGYPADFFVDNIFYKFPETIQNITMQITGTVYENIVTDALDNPLMKVIVECYLI